MSDAIGLAAFIVTSVFLVLFLRAITKPRKPRWNREAPNNAAIDSGSVSTGGTLRDDRDDWSDSHDDGGDGGGGSDGGDGD